MSQIFIEDYIQKIILLEKHVGTKTNYKMLDPFSLNSMDVIEIQKAAKKIAEYIGLRDLLFIIATAKQKEKVGGHIELKSGENEVFIEISDAILKFNDAVLATLVHEICHKYLQINGISLGVDPVHEYENEVLTDITTVFLGLGKLMLNGCECQNVRQEQILGGVRTITETQKIGYLNRSQLAFVFRLICAMRKIPSRDYEQGLSFDSINSLKECEKHYGDYFNDRFHKSDARESSIKSLQSAISTTQSTLSDIERNLLYLQEASVKHIETFLEKTHQKLRSSFLEAQKMVSDNEYDPCLKFLNAKQLDQTVNKFVSEINDYSAESKRYKEAVTKLTNDMQTFDNLFPKPNSDMFTIVTCRNDGTRLRFPRNKTHFIAKCTKCQYQFIADTSPAEILIPSSKKRWGITANNIFKSLFKKK